MMRWFLVLPLLGIAGAVDWDTETPLDKYVNEPDEHYSYTELNSFEYEGVTSYTLNMTSQKWKDETWTTSPIWWHIQYVNIPPVVRFKDVALMFVGGGRNSPDLPTPEDDPFFDMVARFAATVGVVTTYLRNIPNQSIVFTDDPSQRRRTEDSFIAYTWVKYIEDPEDAEILARMPMTKAAVRALDTVAAFAKEKDPSVDLTEFMVGGGSKRGWTAWTLACVDRRVTAVIPMVMDLLNIHESLHHHWMSLGGWSFAFESYHRENATQYLDHPNFHRMLEVIDPFSYKERLTMPKLIISATGDEFFLLDDSHYYYNDLPGQTFLMMCENTHHSLIGHHERILENLIGFFISIKTDFPLPELTWTRSVEEGVGSITVSTSTTPRNIYFYYAETFSDFVDGRRDFRVITNDDIHPVFWELDTPEDLGNNVYKASMDTIEGEYLGFFILLEFIGPEGSVLEFTTEVHIIPDTFPFPDCQGIGCWGELV